MTNLIKLYWIQVEQIQVWPLTKFDNGLIVSNSPIFRKL